RHRRLGYFPDNVWHSPSKQGRTAFGLGRAPLNPNHSITNGLMPVKFGCCPNFRCSAGFHPAFSRQDGGATFKLQQHPNSPIARRLAQAPINSRAAAPSRATRQPREESKRQGRGVLVTGPQEV